MGTQITKARRIALAIALTPVLIAGAGIGCSSSPKHEDYDMVIVDRKSDRQVNVEFDGRCAMAVAEGKLDVPGDDRYSLRHDGKTFYFANEEGMRKFQEKLRENIRRAENNWVNSRVL